MSTQLTFDLDIKLGSRHVCAHFYTNCAKVMTINIKYWVLKVAVLTIYMSPLADAQGIEYQSLFGGNSLSDACWIYSSCQATYDNGAYIVSIFNTNESDLPVADTSCGQYHGGEDIYISIWTRSYSRLIYSAYFGGRADDSAVDVAILDDSTLAIYGSTNSVDFPTTVGAINDTSGDNLHMFYCEIHLADRRLVYSARIGGNGGDAPSAMAVGRNNEAILVGSTSSTDFPVTNSAFQAVNHSAYGIGYIIILSKARSIEYCSYIGGAWSDHITSVATSNDKIVFGGFSQSVDLPTTPNARQPKWGGGKMEMFVGSIDLKENSVDYLSFMGGSDTEKLSSLAVFNEKIYCIGTTASSDYPVSFDAAQSVINNGASGYSHDVFFTVFDLHDWSMIYSSFFGGSKDDYANRAVVNKTGLYLAFDTDSNDLPKSDKSGIRSEKSLAMAEMARFHLDDYSVDTTLILFGGPLPRVVSMCGDENDILYGGYTRGDTVFTTADAYKKERVGLYDAVIGIFRVQSSTNYHAERSIDDFDWRIYPSPAEGNIALWGVPDGICKVDLYNLTLGKVVLSEFYVSHNGRIYIDVSHLRRGSYIVCIEGGLRERQMYKKIILH